MTDITEADNNVLFSFVMQEYSAGNDIPQDVTNYLLSGLLHHVDRDCKQESEKGDLEHFSDKFEAHIRKLKDSHKCLNLNTRRKDYSRMLDEDTSRCQDLNTKKCSELSKCIKLINELMQKRAKLERKFEEAVAHQNAGLDLVEVKQKMLSAKVNATLLNETTQTLEALKKLKGFMDARKIELEERFSILEESEVRYKEIKDNPEFLKLLSEYSKLLKRKQMVNVDWN